LYVCQQLFVVFSYQYFAVRWIDCLLIDALLTLSAQIDKRAGKPLPRVLLSSSIQLCSVECSSSGDGMCTGQCHDALSVLPFWQNAFFQNFGNIVFLSDCFYSPPKKKNLISRLSTDLHQILQECVLLPVAKKMRVSF